MKFEFLLSRILLISTTNSALNLATFKQTSNVIENSIFGNICICRKSTKSKIENFAVLKNWKTIAVDSKRETHHLLQEDVNYPWKRRVAYFRFRYRYIDVNYPSSAIDATDCTLSWFQEKKSTPIWISSRHLTLTIYYCYPDLLSNELNLTVEPLTTEV